MRLGIFGGSFDPVHYGHLLLAECCLEQCRLDEIWFLPASSSPHKQQYESAPAKIRVEMLQLALAGHDSMQVSTIETERGGISFTAQTLAEIHESRPEAKLFFLMGADSLHDLHSWRDPEKVCQLAIPVAVGRPDSPPPDYRSLAGLVSPERLQEIERAQVQSPLIDLSSTDIRRRVCQGKSIRYRTPRAVEKYIETQRLYLD